MSAFSEEINEQGVKVYTCAKCGRHSFMPPTVRYCFCLDPAMPPGEHLHLTCSQCGYEEIEPTKDAQR